ncbi:DUF4830 domain-containing protein [Bacillus tianshenii]|uniref:DUF4830 domain-containing protein n=1 Tax=Sutcliffiella tianshenii TaxID=1463404 RepID=UPI001CD7BA6C|nr:DUF4830 domain-containing protein [Bacillus tianshenii]MCA1320963.1 DUF4830 domain-containing protein [Bacillus tianshenii]
MLILFGSTFLIVGLYYEGNFPEKHKEYIESYGWHIRAMENEEIINLSDYFPETLQMHKEAGLDLEEYKNKEVKVTRYLLREKQRKGESASIFDGNNMYILIYEVEGIIIGGHGHLEGWSPGIFSLEDKERLRGEGILF